MTKDFKFIAKFYKNEMMTQQIENDVFNIRRLFWQ